MTEPSEEDLSLHREISPKERLDAILTSRSMTHAQAVAAMEAGYRENQAMFPHLVIATVMVHETPLSEEEVPFHFYVGPFSDRRAAVVWAEAWYADKPQVSWEAVRLETPQQVEAEDRRLGSILDREPNEPPRPRNDA
jgi:hypothetical protein